ncbi:MAG: M48 family metallopeptidase [Gemmatimonadota bacterium]
MTSIPLARMRVTRHFIARTAGRRPSRAVTVAVRVALTCLLISGCAISTQREIELGTDYSHQVNAQLPIVNDPEVVRYINVLGDSIARVADDRNLDWRFFIVDSPEVNAFAIPGGFVYVNRGLIERTTQMNQLAGVLGHEIGHVVNRHSVKQMQTGQRMNLGMMLGCILTPICTNGGDMAVGMAGQGIMASFSRGDEAESDQAGIEYTMRAGIDPRGIPDMFQILIKERNERPSGGLDAWFRTHPMEEDRVAATQATIAKFNTTLLDRLTRDTPRYQEFKKRLASLPVTTARGQ